MSVRWNPNWYGGVQIWLFANQTLGISHRSPSISLAAAMNKTGAPTAAGFGVAVGDDVNAGLALFTLINTVARVELWFVSSAGSNNTVSVCFAPARGAQGSSADDGCRINPGDYGRCFRDH